MIRPGLYTLKQLETKFQTEIALKLSIENERVMLSTPTDIKSSSKQISSKCLGHVANIQTDE